MTRIKGSSKDVILKDILERLNKLDSRLDNIEQEIEGVKKAVKLVMWIIKGVGAIGTLLTAVYKIWPWIPKGKGAESVQKNIRKK